MGSVLYKVDGGIGVVTLNRPAQLNAINTTLIENLDAALIRALSDPEVDVVLLQANGRAFCAGDDLKELEASPFSDEISRHFVELLQAITRHLPNRLPTFDRVVTSAGFMSFIAAEFDRPDTSKDGEPDLKELGYQQFMIARLGRANQ